MADYVVRDLSLAPWGRKEIEIAETEMPGLMALRAEFGREHRELVGGENRAAEGLFRVPGR